MLTVSRAKPGGPPISADGKRVRLTIGNGSRVVEALRGELVSESANWIIYSDKVVIEFLIQQQRRKNGRVDRQYGTLCRLTTSTSIPT